MSMDLAVECYAATDGFPKSELYGITGQIRRSASSVAANIAEGHGRESTGSFVQHLRIAQGSLKELETHLLLSARIGLTSADALQKLLYATDEIGKMIRALIRNLQEK
jgi:four helix bundle protein